MSGFHAGEERLEVMLRGWFAQGLDANQCKVEMAMSICDAAREPRSQEARVALQRAFNFIDVIWAEHVKR